MYFLKLFFFPLGLWPKYPSNPLKIFLIHIKSCCLGSPGSFLAKGLREAWSLRKLLCEFPVAFCPPRRSILNLPSWGQRASSQMLMVTPRRA